MATSRLTSTRPQAEDTDDYGIERVTSDESGPIDKVRERAPWLDHLLRMNERYGLMGGNQYAAGITYFSVLSLFPLLMLAFATIGFVLAARPETVAQIHDWIAGSVSGELGEQLAEILDTAIGQRSALAGVGVLTALWSGLNWMNNLRYGVSKMWKFNPLEGNFVVTKLKDLLTLISLLLALAIAFGLMAAGNADVLSRVLSYFGLTEAPGAYLLIRSATLLVGVIANYVIFLWLILVLPRGSVPRRSAAKAALIGAVAFEIFKQLGSVFFSNALSNPAGATFGPIIGVMVLLYFIWRILLYCSAWAATTEESLAQAEHPAPAPAIIRVREEINPTPQPRLVAGLLGAGAALGAVAAAGAALLNRRDN